MALNNPDRQLLRELLTVARNAGALTTTGFDQKRLHHIGHSLGLDSAATDAAALRLQEGGALRNKARDWRVVSAYFMLTDAGIQMALRSDESAG
jgi:hypothetical protein